MSADQPPYRLFYAPLCRSVRQHAGFDHHALLRRECACPCHGGPAPWWSDHKATNAPGREPSANDSAQGVDNTDPSPSVVRQSAQRREEQS